jgi:FtsZ-interacting cell division protein ZipA
VVWERRKGGGAAAGGVAPTAARTTRDDADSAAEFDDAAAARDEPAEDDRDGVIGPARVVEVPTAPARRERVREPPLVEIVDPAVEGLEDGPGVVSLPVMSAQHGPELGAAAVERAAQWLAETQPSVQPGAAAPRKALRLEWPDDSQRRIIALRVVARAGERFTGGSVRQALQGEGFEFGEFEIFHLPIEDGRVLISAANLTKPGSFRLQKMDTETLLGLNVFAVLPGPRDPLETFDRLHAVAGLLAQRLRGEVRDAAGQALSGVRLAELRREAAGADAARSSH